MVLARHKSIFHRVAEEDYQEHIAAEGLANDELVSLREKFYTCDRCQDFDNSVHLPKPFWFLRFMCLVAGAGFEPATTGLWVRCSNQTELPCKNFLWPDINLEPLTMSTALGNERRAAG